MREFSAGSIEWTDGMCYPVLQRPERIGHVEARWERAESAFDVMGSGTPPERLACPWQT